MAPLEVYRKEIKYEMPLCVFCQLEARLSAVLKKDGFSREQGGYPVRSLYFDTPFEADYEAARDGLLVRKKFRLRIYSPAEERVKLERKAKIGQDQVKTDLILTRDEARLLMKGKPSFLLAKRDAFAQELYLDFCMGAYKPRILIEYGRIAYTAPANNIRITYDSNIRYSRSNLDLFSPVVAFTPLYDQAMGVLEVKYDGFLFTYIREALRGMDALPEAFGKYIQCCALL